RRFASPLNAGLSLFRLNPATGGLDLLAGNDDTRNDTPASNGLSLPLFADPAVFAGLTAGDYYLAVSARGDVPDPARDLWPGTDGIFDPLVSHSATAGSTTGSYVLNVLVQPD